MPGVRNRCGIRAAPALQCSIGMTDEPQKPTPPTITDPAEQGKIGWALAWLIGIPLPLLLVVYLITRAC